MTTPKTPLDKAWDTYDDLMDDRGDPRQYPGPDAKRQAQEGVEAQAAQEAVEPWARALQDVYSLLPASRVTAIRPETAALMNKGLLLLTDTTDTGKPCMCSYPLGFKVWCRLPPFHWLFGEKEHRS